MTAPDTICSDKSCQSPLGYHGEGNLRPPIALCPHFPRQDPPCEIRPCPKDYSVKASSR